VTERPPARPNDILRRPGLWVVTLSAILYACIVVPDWNPSWDSATYITLARSLVAGDGYTYMGYDHTKYPPGFPLMLSPLLALFGVKYLPMRALIAFCAVGSIGLVYATLRRSAGTWTAVAVASMTATSSALLYESTRILSDIPYMLLSFATLLAALRLGEIRSKRSLALVGALCGTAFLVRLVGISLAGAVTLALVADGARSGWRTAIRHAAMVLACVALPMALWLAHTVTADNVMRSTTREAQSYGHELLSGGAQGPQSEAGILTTLRARLAANARYYAKAATELLTANRSRAPWPALLVFAGWCIAAIRRRGVIEWYFVAYFAIFMLWPARRGDRFLLPVLPLIFYYALIASSTGAVALARLARSASGWLRFVEMTTIATLAAMFVIGSAGQVLARVKAEHRVPYLQGVDAEYVEALVWLRSNSPADTVLVTNRAPYGVLLAERPTYTVPWVADEAKILSFIREIGATHALTNRSTRRYLGPVVEANPERFELIERFGSTRVYAVIHEPD